MPPGKIFKFSNRLDIRLRLMHTSILFFRHRYIHKPHSGNDPSDLLAGVSVYVYRAGK